jgi:hypothetical protein
MKKFICVALLFYLPTLVISQNNKNQSPQYEVWKTVDGIVQMYSSIKDFYTSDSSFKITETAGYIFDKCEFAVPADCVTFVKVTCKDLDIKTFLKRINYQDILLSAAKAGLKPCKPEDVTILRRIYPEQSDSEFICIATDPIKDHSGSQYVFTLLTTTNKECKTPSLVIDGIELTDSITKYYFPSKQWVYIFRI